MKQHMSRRNRRNKQPVKAEASHDQVSNREIDQVNDEPSGATDEVISTEAPKPQPDINTASDTSADTIKIARTSRVLEGIVLKDLELIEKIKELISKYDLGKESEIRRAFSNLQGYYPTESRSIVDVERRLMGTIEAKSSKVTVSDDKLFDDCGGCLSGQRETTIRYMRSCKSTRELDQLISEVLQFRKDKEVVYVARSLMMSKGYDLEMIKLEDGTMVISREDALRQLYEMLQKT